jgi:hypothetical protein
MKSVNNKVTVLSPDQPVPPVQLHAGWGNGKRKMHNAGACKSEMARVYKRAAAGMMDTEDMKAAIWALRQIADVAERAELEAKISKLEAKLADLLRGH